MTVDGAEIALAVDQRIAQAPRLGQANHGVVYGAIAMGVILLQTFAHHTGALHVLAVVKHTHVVHGIQNAPMHGLEAVAHIGQCASDDVCFRATPDPALNLGTLQTGYGALTEANTFLLRHCGEDADHSFFEDASAVQILLCERPIADAIACEPLKVVQRLYGAFTAQPVERPEEHKVELPLGRRCKHLLELITVATLTAGPIHVLLNDRPALRLCESPELP